MVRAKFKVVSHTRSEYPQVEVVMRPEYDDKIPEDQRFSQYTPNGELRMTVNNPAAVEQLAIGKKFYLDFTPVEA